MKHDDVLVNGFGGTDFCTKVKENIGRSHGSNGLHFQTHTTFSSSTELTLRPLTFGPPPPAAFPIHPTSAMVYTTASDGPSLDSAPRIKEEVSDPEDKARQSSTVPTISNGFIRDVSNAWLHTLADLCDWRSKHDKTPPDVNTPDSALIPAIGQGCDKSSNERENGSVRKGTNGFSANGSAPRTDYMISTILAGSSRSDSNCDAMVTGGGIISPSNPETNRTPNTPGHVNNSTYAFENSSKRLRTMQNSQEVTSLRAGGAIESQEPQSIDASMSSIPTRNLPPRKRHMRAMVSPPTVQTTPSIPSNYGISPRTSPPSEAFQHDSSNQSGYSINVPTEAEPLSKPLISNDLRSSVNGSQMKRKDILQPLDSVHPSKRPAVDRMSASARDSPSSLESFASSNSDNSNRSSPFLTDPSTPESGHCTGNSSGDSSRSGDPSPCQPIFNQSVLPSRLQPPFQPLSLSSNVAMPTPNAVLQRPGDLQAQVTLQQTTRYSISQEMMAQYNGQVPQMQSLQHVPAVYPGQFPNTQLNQAVAADPRASFNANQVYPQQNAQDTRGPIVPTTQTPPVGGTTLRPIPLHYQNGFPNGFTPHLDPSQPRHTMQSFHDQPPRSIGPLPSQSLAQPAFPPLSNPPARGTWIPTTSTTQGIANGFAGAPQEPQLQQNQAVSTVTVQPPPATTASMEYAPLKRAPGRSRLNNHVSSGVPVGDSTFLCEVCNKVFPLQRLLNRHMKCHSATKRYSCAFCGKGFNDTFDLKRHVRTHTGVRPYKCEKCGKAFTQRCSLESHLSKVHGEQHRYSYKQRRSKIFVCEECGITTETADNHYEHIKSKHPDSTELRKYQDKLQFQKLVMQQEAAAAAGGEGAVEFPRSRPDLSPTSELMLYREHDEAALPLQNRAEQQRRMSEMRTPEELSPASSGSSGSGE